MKNPERAADAAADLLRSGLSRRRDDAGDRPGWIVNCLQMMAGFGISTGSVSASPANACSRHRGRASVVRSANTGISAVIDPVGRIIARRLDLGVEGVLDSRLPAALAPTIYARQRRYAGRRSIAAIAIVFVLRTSQQGARLTSHGITFSTWLPLLL